ncbi:MAG: serine acetyltransferase [Acidobacteriota bacterium]|nr:MAG: serine acetyltransferase [Acidobacteriota bacterium]
MAKRAPSKTKTARSSKSASPSSAAEENAFASVVDALCGTEGGAGSADVLLPSRDVVIRIVENLRSVFFPGYFQAAPERLDSELKEGLRFHVGAVLDRVRRDLKEQIGRALRFVDSRKGAPGKKRASDYDERASSLSKAFLSRLPEVRRVLATDVQAAYEGDPAATSPDEAIFCYPGIVAITHHRIAHELYLLEVPLLSRIIGEHAHSITGIDIHPGAAIGESFFIDHGTGVVIGETSVIGNRVRIYQGVTLGAKSFPKDEKGRLVKGIPRHPVVEDDVIIYAEATILGRVVIGRGSIIGGNVWLTRSVPPGSRVTQAQAQEESFKGGAGI